MTLAEIDAGEKLFVKSDEFKDLWGLRTMMKLRDPLLILDGREQPRRRSGEEPPAVLRYRVVDLASGEISDVLGSTDVIPFCVG